MSTSERLFMWHNTSGAARLTAPRRSTICSLKTVVVAPPPGSLLAVMRAQCCNVVVFEHLMKCAIKNIQIACVQFALKQIEHYWQKCMKNG